jgi:hypothetical protein
MRRTVTSGCVSASATLRGPFRPALIAIVMLPGAAIAQQAPTPAPDPNAVPLPEIRVIGTTPIPPPRPAPQPAAAAPSVGTAAAAEPGAIDRDKVLANVQAMSASDFDHAKAPNLLESLERGLPGVWSATRPAIADLSIFGSQYLVGDESNQNPKLPAY